MCCYSSEVVSTSTDIFYVRFVFLFLFVFYFTHIVQTSFLIAVSVGVISCYIICYVSLHCFVGDRNSVGSVGSSRSTGSGQSSESFNPNPNKQNESHVRTDMCKVNAYTNILCILNAYTYKHLTLKSSWNDLTFNIQSGSKLHFFFIRCPPLLVNQENNSIKCQRMMAKWQMEQWVIPILVIYVTCGCPALISYVAWGFYQEFGIKS